MALTLEQHVAVYNALDAEEIKARRAAVKAQANFRDAQVEYGGSVERETAAVLLNLRTEQYMAAQRASAAYFNAYIKNAA